MRMASIFDSAEFNENLFFPRSDSSSPPSGKREIFIEVEEGVRIHSRQYPFAGAKFSLLYFHGNGEIVSDYDDMEEAFRNLGAELIVCDYRGYGKSSGTPTLRSVLKDAHVIYETLKRDGRLLPDVYVMGRSLGSAPAIELCAGHKDIVGCIIESGYADPVPLVRRRGLHVDTIAPEDHALFNNGKKIARVTCPLLVMHGEEDWLISSDEAETNHRQAGAKLKILKILDGVGHNDMTAATDYFSSLKEFFDTVSQS